MKYSAMVRKAAAGLGGQTRGEKRAMRKSKRLRVRRVQNKAAGMARKAC